MNTFSKPNEQLFPNRWPLSYLKLFCLILSLIHDIENKNDQNERVVLISIISFPPLDLPTVRNDCYRWYHWQPEKRSGFTIGYQC